MVFTYILQILMYDKSMTVVNLDRPYYRIVRPNARGDWYGDYIFDPRYSRNWSSSIRALELVIIDFKKICQYVDPCDENFTTFSHRIYELFFRACTEFESNCKDILKANHYILKDSKGNTRDEKWWNVNDYKKINAACKLHDYKISFIFWNSGQGTFLEPFRNLGPGGSASLVWYDIYSNLKHNRDAHFFDASLGNLIDAIAALIVVLFAQYSVQIFNPYQIVSSWDYTNDILYTPDSIFGIKPPNMLSGECYSFDWEKVKLLPDPFRVFTF